VTAATTRRGRLGGIPEPVDMSLVLATFVLLGLGVVMVASASLHKIADAPLYFTLRHTVAIGLGLAGSALVLAIPVNQWERWSTTLYFVGLGLLIAVLIPGVGREANGAVRWISVGGFNLQSSEFMKLFMMLYLAGYLQRRREEVAYSVWGFVKPMLLLVVAAALIMLQPDFGTTVVLMATAMGMLFLGGVPLWQFSVLFAMATATMTTLILLAPYRLQRVSSFIDPFDDPLNTDYQLSNALIAFGRGEWFGVGLGNGIQKQFYLPESHNDFLMAVIGEELGFAGTLFVIAMFCLICWRAFSIGTSAERRDARFAAYVAYGCGLWVGLQAFINLGVNLGLLPTKGLTLPLMSYGGNSVIVSCLVVAMLLRIHRENVASLRDKGGKW
jgi:cell division protein FtsW